MADLDNFFAKKDRKKTKGQKFATSSDNMATGQEELQKKQDKQKKERSERSLTIQNNYATENDNKSSKMMEEEWNEYQEEIKDYTTLKMQNLTADCPSSLTDNNDKDDEIEFEENEAGEMVPKRKNAGPWKLNEPEQPPPPPKAAPPVVAAVQKNVYVPPAQRNNFQGGHRSAPRNKSSSLDVKDEEMFPTLSGNNSTKKSVAPAARKVETPAWAKYQ